MELIKFENRQPSRIWFHVLVSVEEFKRAINSIAKIKIKKFTVPGFRKGKAPKSVVEKYYGENVFYDDAVDFIFPEVLDFVGKESCTDILKGDQNMALDMIKTEPTQGLEIQATIDIKPTVELADYKGIHVNVPKNEVAGDAVDRHIEGVLNRHARKIEVKDIPAENGHVVNINFTGYIDGEPFEHGAAESFDLNLGSHQFIAGFEEKVVGHTAGEEFDVNVTFPEEYHVSKLAGKEAVFKVKLNSIYKREKPEFNLDFVKETSQFDTIEEYKQDIAKKLESNAQLEYERRLNMTVEERVIGLVTSEVPKSLIDQRVTAMFKEFETNVSRQGIKMEDYLKFSGLTLDEIKKNMVPEAEDNVKFMLALNEIIVKENITIPDDDVDAEFQAIADKYKMDVEEIKPMISVDEIKENLKFSRAFKVVTDNAVNDWILNQEAEKNTPEITPDEIKPDEIQPNEEV